MRGGTAINVFSKQHGFNLQVVDAGVMGNFPPILPIIHQKVGHGTKSSLHESAMSLLEVEKCIELGAKVVQDIFEKNCNVIGFGEMGIGNTSSASLLMSKICNIPLVDCVGRGTGVDDKGLKHKISILANVLNKHQEEESTLQTLANLGGFEIAQMVGAMLQAAQNQMIILIDGFIATSAFLVAHVLEPNVLDYAIFCHQSDENGHKQMLKYLKVEAILKLNLRLGKPPSALFSPISQSESYVLLSKPCSILHTLNPPRSNYIVRQFAQNVLLRAFFFRFLSANKRVVKSPFGSPRSPDYTQKFL